MRGFGELLEPGSLNGFMGLADTDRAGTASGRSIVLAGRRLRGRTPDAGAGAVRLRRHPLGDDAGPADARLAPRARDPRRDALGAEADQGPGARASRAPTSSPT